MSQNRPHAIELKDEQIAFLEEMAREYGLSDASKAVRCLVNFALEDEARREAIFGEVRCLFC